MTGIAPRADIPAPIKYVSSTANTVALLGTGAYLASKVCNKCPTIAKLNGMVPRFYTFLGAGFFAGHLYSLGSDLETYRIISQDQDELKSSKEKKQKPLLEKMVPENGFLVGRGGWLAYRAARHIAKLVATGVLLYEGAQAMNVISSGPSNLLKRVGSSVGIGAYLLDILDLTKKTKDGNEDGRNALINGAEHVLMIAVNIAALTVTFKAYKECEGFVGSVVKFADAHTVDIYGSLFAAHFATHLGRHILCKEAIKKNEEGKLESNHKFLKYISDEFFGSRSFVRLLKLVAGIGAECEVSAGQLLGMSKHFDAFFHFSKIGNSFADPKKGVIQKYLEASEEFKKGKTGKAIDTVGLPTIELLSNVFGLAKWGLGLSGYSRYARYCGYLKSVASISAAVIHINRARIEIQKPDKKTEQGLKLAARSLSIIGNVITMMGTYAGPAIKTRGGPVVPNWFNFALAGVIWSAFEAQSVHKAWTA